MEKSGSVTIGGGGVGFCGLITIAFVVLKLCKVITWSWFWVLSPLIFSVAIWLLLIIAIIIYALIS